jgi:coproporphyrinogen III oxidase-like Fe-S oxidoreductase
MPPDSVAQAAGSAATLYVHIPFCCRRCAYCGTFRVAEREAAYDPFLKAVAREWALTREELGEGAARPLAAVYVGGGMPSLFGPQRLAGLLEILREGPAWNPDCEVTLEVYPGSFDREGASALRSAGFNRLHIRAHSFRDSELAFLERGYTAEQARVAVQAAQEAGFSALSLDLRYGIPGQTLDTWTGTLKDATGLACGHITCNQIGRREETLHDRLLRGSFRESSLDEQLLTHYQAAVRRLGEAGYEHYEVESFALPGGRCRYSLNVWQRGIGYGLGPGAHSFDGAVRWRNAGDLGAYLTRLLEAGQQPPRERYRLSPENVAQEILCLGLRQAAGVSWEALADCLGAATLARVERKVRVLATQGFLEQTRVGIRLQPQAYFVADGVVLELIRVLEDRTA